MEVCVFNSSISFLVNGSATNDFKVEGGLRQGDPLSPFIFVITMEGLIGLVGIAKEQQEFKGFKVNDEVTFNILQFTDDTVIFRDGGSDNLWIINTLLRGFKLISCIRVNLCKSSVFSINVCKWYLGVASSFLSCRVNSILLNSYESWREASL